MSNDDSTQPNARPDSGARMMRAARVWGALVDGLGAIGSMLIVALMLVICADVLSRNIMGASLPLVSELGALMVVMIVYLQLATTLRHDRLARADVFYTGFRALHPRKGAVLGALFDLAGAWVIGVMALATLRVLERDIASGQFIGVTGVLTLPTWLFRAAILAGMTIAMVQFVLSVLAALQIAVAGERDDRA
ncbi:TRAP transporter small permease subunit [Roseinatronobacter sp.]|uniref:TRAP transporter small permease subunit n=1 Tax=Roseinatronobacter sp. TaxID=1945755 RepID=UPI003F72D403